MEKWVTQILLNQRPKGDSALETDCRWIKEAKASYREGSIKRLTQEHGSALNGE